MELNELAPAQQVRDQIIACLRNAAAGFTYPIQETQIRASMDVSGTPKDAAGISVNASDMGDHSSAGNTGRVLVDIAPSVSVYTHVDEDADGSICDTIASDALAAIRALSYSLSGWTVAFNGIWQASETQTDGNFRAISLTATLPLIRQ